MQLPDLHGRNALVTGGGRGIGRATALLLAQCGARVVVTARSSEIDTVAAEIVAAGGDALAVPADVSREDHVRRLVDNAGDVDILVNNAGVIWPIALLAEADPETWSGSIAINLTGVFLTMHAVLPGMIARNWGRIVNVSSGAARGTTAGWSAYSAAKAGVEAMTSVASRELADRDIRVVGVRPGIVDTEMQVEIRSSGEEQFTRENVDRFRGYKERGLLRPPEHPARLIVWLLGDDAVEYNGTTVALDDPEIAAKVDLEPMAR
jgi:NAD(P)-dependent dehydrogenase (short-subunit alcohol dehydrogenase family)